MLSVNKLSTSQSSGINLSEISFSFKEKEIVLVLGDSQSGKSELLAALAGLIPFEGDVKINRYSLKDEPIKAKAFLGYLGYPPLLDEAFTPMELLELIAAIHSLNSQAARQVILSLSKELNVLNNLFTNIERLSLGERQKVALIASVLHQSTVLLLDEPLIHLDILEQRKALNLIKRFQESGSTVVVATNMPYLFQDITAKVLILKEGVLVFEGSPLELKNHLHQHKLPLEDLLKNIIS